MILSSKKPDRNQPQKTKGIHLLSNREMDSLFHRYNKQNL